MDGAPVPRPEAEHEPDPGSEKKLATDMSNGQALPEAPDDASRLEAELEEMRSAIAVGISRLSRQVRYRTSAGSFTVNYVVAPRGAEPHKDWAVVPPGYNWRP